MKIEKLRIRGEELPPAPASTLEHFNEHQVIVVSGLTRGDQPPVEITLKETDVVEFQFEDGSVWMSRPDTIEEVFPEMAVKTRAAGSDIFEIPTQLSTGISERGIFKDIALKLVKVFTKKQLDKAMSPIIKDLAGKLEDKQLGDLRGLLQLTPDFGLQPVVLNENADRPYLLFIHGTASSTAGSFDKIKTSAFWRNVFQSKKFENILAFQHESLTKNPLQNVLELVTQLPKKATLHLVTQSRGGIVGDILNRFCATGAGERGFSFDERNYLKNNGRPKDVDLILQIEAEIIKKEISIAKYIRVACPASGTTLASKRLDHLLNIIFNLLGLAIGQNANPVYIAFKNLLTAVVESKDNPDALPGLDIQNPGSAFIKMLNNGLPDTTIVTPLVVIAGNSKVNLKWKALVVIASKLFYLGKNDLIVDTQSMFNGAKRAESRVQFFLDESPDVSHFNYFENESTRKALLLALENSAEELIPGFTWLTTRKTEDKIRLFGLDGGKFFRDEVSGKRPIVLLLPGIMGSNLSLEKNNIWINYFKFLSGGLSNLQYTESNNKHIRPESIVKTSYKKLADYLESNYDVITFPFDWRRPLNECAEDLNRKIKELMQLETPQPIKLIGHSMGGVLVRDFMVQFPDTWKALNASRGFQLLFLGSPLGGSYRIPYVLFGKDSIINKLSMIDLYHSKKQLIDLFRNFPGILSLLPFSKEDKKDFALQETWEYMRDHFGDASWPIPEKTVLEAFGKYRDNVLSKLSSNEINYLNAVYIAGQARADKDTPSGYRINNGQLEFLATKEGDESVTWETGIPPAIIAKENVYYCDVTHGELANDPTLFGAIADVLNTGKTAMLKKQKPLTRSIEKEFVARPDFDFDLSEVGIQKTLLGLDLEPPTKKSEIPIAVHICNGDLKYASFPVLAGHFLNDGILYAEQSIDRYLDNELSSRHQLGLYPGETGSSEVFINHESAIFKGAVIIGLGKQGELNEFLLTRSVEQGATKYLSIYNSKLGKTNLQSEDKESIGISALIIGRGYGGLNIESSIRAIIQGVQNANGKIRNIYKTARTIDTIEFVELYQDLSLAAAYALGKIEKDENRTLNINWENRNIKALFGWRKRIPLEWNQDWWTRIIVRQQYKEEDDCKKKKRGLSFTISTNAAREEEKQMRTGSETVHQLLEEMSVKNKWNRDLAKAIFELMIPNEFKEQVKRQNNLNWILDKETAAFPWELLQDGAADAMPLSVNAGMVRQLITMDYRLTVNPVMEKKALVIADPFLDNFYTQLEGALNEGEQVGTTLKNHGYETNVLLNKTAAEIMLAIFSQNYKLIHLAGHGVFNPDPDMPTGMVIGKNAYLTTSEISKMSAVPEMVFVNCCYLGKTNAETETLYQSRYRLAANIGTQLIEMGVRAIIVAGWAVDDEAALAFTEHFYAAMFDGDEFGKATRKARKKVYEEFGYRTNTWGAFQCYGDPFYKLTSNGKKTDDELVFILAEEAAIELENLFNEINTGFYNEEKVLEKLKRISTAVDKASLRNSRITELEAYILAGMNDYESAIGRFDQLLKEEKAGYSFRASEQYCNIRAKYYVFQAGEGKKSSELEPSMKKVIDDLEHLNDFCSTLERLNMLGSTYKRYAFVVGGAKKKQAALEKSITYYLQSYCNGSNKNKYYPLTNWLALENALVLAGLREWGSHNIKDCTLPASANEAMDLLLDDLKKIADANESEPDFWTLVREANNLFCLMLLGHKDSDVERVKAAYKKAWDKAGNKGQKQAEIEQMDLVSAALKLAPKEKNEKLLEAIDRLKSYLKGLM